MASTQRFFALWIVTIVVVAALAFCVGIVDYFLAEPRRAVYGECWEGMITGECLYDRNDYFIAYPEFSLFWSIPGYLLARIVCDSFRLVFGKK